MHVAYLTYYGQQRKANLLMDTLNKIILEDLQKVAAAALKWEIKLGTSISCMPSGHNGPYYDIETPLRNTAHWLTFFSIVFKLTEDSSCKEIAQRLFSYIKSPSFPPQNFAYIHRQKPGKDGCNGVIGAAWLIEALLRYSKYVDNSSNALQLARSIAVTFPFDSKQGAWKIHDAHKGILGFDVTYNHQAWFAASLAELHSDYHRDVSSFLNESLKGAFRVRPVGRINHLIKLRGVRNQSIWVKYILSYYHNQNKINLKENGYHLYVLFAFARLKRCFPNHPIFSCEPFLHALNYVLSSDFSNGIEKSPYSFPYNAPGFELPLIVKTFSEIEKKLKKLDLNYFYEEQIRRTFSKEIDLYVKSCPDPFTLASRIYELAISVEDIGIN